ncbi:VWA domain-containing protein, partial [Aliarcobacter cryaerophilus]
TATESVAGSTINGTDNGTGTITDDRATDNPNVDEDIPLIKIYGNDVSEEQSGTSTGNKVVGTITAEITNGVIPSKDIVIDLGNGKIITIPAGSTTGIASTEVDTTRVDDYYDQGETNENFVGTITSGNALFVDGTTTSTATVTINDDKDPTEVKITPIITVEKMIDKDNIYDEERPFTITGYQNYGKADQSESTLSNVSTTQNGLPVKGFGVEGYISGGNNNGDVSELQYGEAIVIDFEDKSVLGIDVAFAWRNQDESAKIEFFDKAGASIGTATISGGANGNAGATSTITYTFKDKDGNTQTESKTIQGGSDGIDKPFELMLPNGEQFTKIVFTAPNVNDDYLINSIGYKEVIDGNSLDKGQKAEVTFIVETNHKPDPDWTNPNRTDGKPTADVKIEDSKGNVLFNGTVVLDADGKAIIPDIKADGVNDLKATVTNVQGNFELVDYSKAEAGVYVGDIETEKNTNDTITGTKGNDVIVGDEGGTSKKIVDGQNYNIAIIVDKSNSMKASSGTGSMNRMELLKASLNNLADTLANHDGVINLSIIGFGTHADTAIVFNNLTSSDLTALKNSINGLNGYNNTWNSQVGGTNYEAAFNATKAWFDGLSSSNDASYENMTYFLTDGEPTQYGTGQGTGNAYDSTADSKGQIAYNNLVNTHDVKVYAIGIGNDVSVNTLNKYDNTEIEVMDIKTNAQTIETETFSNNGNTLPTGWEHTGSGSAVVSGQKLVITDNNTSNSNFASVKSKTYEIGKDTYGKLSFDYSVSNSDYRSDDKSTIILQKLINGEWEDIGTPQTITSGSGSYKSQLLSEGEYRLVINVNDTTSSRTYKLSIDNVKLQATSDLDKLEFKKVDIVNTAEDLDAALQAGNTTYDPAKLGSDIITGGAGNDIIFGDTINTDHLTWAGRILPAGSGTEALKEMIKVQNPGISDEDLAQKMYDYIKENHASLGGDGTKDGNDTITGGAGRDIIYGQGGNDTIITDINTNNGEADGDILIDGGTGFDTIKLEGNNDIDFSKLGDIIKNIEAIDLTEGDHKLTNITLDDVLKMTDSNKELIILRDSKDSVLFKDTVGENGQAQTWLKAENSIVEDGKTFEVYKNSGDESLKVKVEQPISDGI